jgi:hypothetical protein
MERPTKTQDAQRLKYCPLRICILCKGDARSRRALLQALHATCCRGQDMGLAHQLAPDLAPGLALEPSDYPSVRKNWSKLPDMGTHISSRQTWRLSWCVLRKTTLARNLADIVPDIRALRAGLFHRTVSPATYPELPSRLWKFSFACRIVVQWLFLVRGLAP